MNIRHNMIASGVLSLLAIALVAGLGLWGQSRLAKALRPGVRSGLAQASEVD